jgi:hypothetical protein
VADRFVIDDTDGIREHLIVDDAEKKVHVEYTQDVTAILDANAAIRNNGADGYGPSRNDRLVARIPVAILHLWSQLSGVDVCAPENADLFRRYLNDPEWSKLRTSGGKVG